MCKTFFFENLYFTRMVYPAAKQTENNNLTNLTIHINKFSQHIEHNEVGNTNILRGENVSYYTGNVFL